MWRYTMRYKKLLFADFICVFGFILIELGLPTILARMIDKGIIPRDMDYIYQQGIWMVVITIIGNYNHPNPLLINIVHISRNNSFVNHSC